MKKKIMKAKPAIATIRRAISKEVGFTYDYAERTHIWRIQTEKKTPKKKSPNLW